MSYNSALPVDRRVSHQTWLVAYWPAASARSLAKTIAHASASVGARPILQLLAWLIVRVPLCQNGLNLLG